MSEILINCAHDKVLALGKLKPNPKNPNQHTKDQINLLAKIIAHQGWRSPIVVSTRSGLMTKGHARLSAAKQLKQRRVPVDFQDYKNAKDEMADMVADNEIARLAHSDMELISEIALGLGPNFDLDLLGIPGFVLPEAEKTDGLTDPDEIPEKVESRCKPGDLWILGDHRLFCGDATKCGWPGVDTTFSLCLTDPPYSVNYDRSQKERGGKKTVHDPYKEADLDPAHILTFLQWTPDLLIFSYSLNRHFYTLAKLLEHYGYKVQKELIWVKDSFSFWPGASYQQRHEPFLVCTKGKGSFRGSVPANESTVFEIQRPRSHDLHPTAKPMELWEKFVKYHSKKGEKVFDPFLGSGTTLIGCESLGRICYGIEIEPKYCDIILKRWEQFTGKKAKKEIGKAKRKTKRKVH